MGKERDRIPADIACINTKKMPATLVSTTGYHCEVWRRPGMVIRDGARHSSDIVVKRHLQPCSLAEVRVLHKEYRELKRQLADMVPAALFVASMVDGVDNVVVIADAVRPWFNIANPANESESIPLLRRLQRARSQLKVFVHAAKYWRDRHDKIIDLYGIDNLVLDVNRNIKYIDSFRVFFYSDVLYAIDGVDELWQEKVDLSLRRLDYLEYMLKESRVARIPRIGF